MTRRRVLVGAGSVFVSIVVITLAFAVRQKLHDEHGGGGAAPVARPSSAALTPCESGVNHMFMRYAMVAKAGGNTDLLIGEEQAQYGLGSPSFNAYKAVLNDFVVMGASQEEPWTGLGGVMSRLRPKVRYWCERYGG